MDTELHKILEAIYLEMKTHTNSTKKPINQSTWKLATDYLKDILSQNSDQTARMGLELGVSALLAKTVLRRLPLPFNLLVPIVAEKIILKHGVDTGRDLLLKGLRWVKKRTDQ
jgi:hypothetical protein